MTDPLPRWRYRFDNYQRAYYLLREAMLEHAAKPLSQLEKEGAVQRFEFTLELGWKVLKDFLEAQGIVLDEVTPRAVVRQALAANLIMDAQAWIDALDMRNRLSHTYDQAGFEKALVEITDRYLSVFGDLYAMLKARAV
jgi:nucleotidyltransferase substrate binding protein (TIGR01987 family)